MADFETKLRWLSERGTPVGAEELIERIETELAVGPLVVVAKRREGSVMTGTQSSGAGRSSRSRGPAWALAAFIAAIAVGGLLYLSMSGDDGEVVDESTELFVDLAPGEAVERPAAPLGDRGNPGAVWTGTEMIVWGGRGRESEPVSDGAAFDVAAGTWRVIAPAPISARQYPGAVWTGTEMIVWGGFGVGDARLYDGAAYDPATDTWRLLPPIPIFMGTGSTITSLIWTGVEAVALSGEAAAAYDPIMDSWRPLSNPSSTAWTARWSGDAIVLVNENLMVRYDPAADRSSVFDIGPSAALVGVPGPDGVVSSFVILRPELGAPVGLLDGTGSLVAELPAFPGDPTLFGDHVGASGLWLGDEAVFWIWTGEFPYPYTQVWALNPNTGTWRQLPGALVDHDGLVVAGDVLLTWRFDGGGVAYRGGTPESE